nr:hypothetical protein [uncultured Allomuricauda sp.]
MANNNINSREVSRRSSIEQGIIASILELDKADEMVFAPEALKNMSKRPVSLEVLKEIIEQSESLEKINPTTGTTRVNGKILELKYKLTQDGSLRFFDILIGGAEAKLTSVEKPLKNVLMQNNGKVRILIVASTGLGTWKLDVSSIKQKLPDGTVVKRKFLEDITHTVNGRRTKKHEKLYETQTIS